MRCAAPGSNNQLEAAAATAVGTALMAVTSLTSLDVTCAATHPPRMACCKLSRPSLALSWAVCLTGDRCYARCNPYARDGVLPCRARACCVRCVVTLVCVGPAGRTWATASGRCLPPCCRAPPPSRSRLFLRLVCLHCRALLVLSSGGSSRVPAGDVGRARGAGERRGGQGEKFRGS